MYQCYGNPKKPCALSCFVSRGEGKIHFDMHNQYIIHVFCIDIEGLGLGKRVSECMWRAERRRREGRLDGWTNGPMDGWTGGRTDG